MPKILFISYSHDSEQHKTWVKKFTDDLVALGDFEILLDQNLPKGFSLTRFMEQGLVKADKVLVIGTPQYKQKSEAGKGVAFEGSIISTELMQDFDTCKYYPILRSGTFETSFPISLQARGGDDLSDDSKYDEMVRIVVDSITNEKPIPAALLKSNTHICLNQEAVAKVYLSQNILFETFWGRPNGIINGIAIGVQITNINKEIRYFNQPTFIVSVPIEGESDSFLMLNSVVPVHFPVKLEYGQQVSVSYKLVPGNIEMFARMVDNDPNATIKAIVTTSLGERIESEDYKLSEIVKNREYVK